MSLRTSSKNVCSTSDVICADAQVAQLQIVACRKGVEAPVQTRGAPVDALRSDSDARQHRFPHPRIEAAGFLNETPSRTWHP